ncbi:MAG TPA: UvrD-helicase domain-containing protein [Phycisphaerae bacterium]|nr:UvrD-helicase domain-containing protein [Phycisphaerae bacterium]
MSLDDLFNDLTESQAQAVAHTDGPIRVLAGPGSGKTRVITRRAVHLARTVARPDQVLAITFTNKAAGEMRERIASLGCGRGPFGPMWVCTFHSLCARLLREYGYELGLKSNFTIFDDSDQRSLLKQVIAECGLSTDNWSPRMAQEAISQAKNKLKTPGDVENDATDFTTRTIARIYGKYQEALTAQNAADFDDLLMSMARILQHFDRVRTELADRFRYLLIDEYQDTNHAQYVIAKLMAIHQNICATGDPDQSIYGWRGADIQNILDFEKDFPNATVVRLEENFRSTGLILSSASGVIRNNYRRKAKELWSNLEPGEAVRIWTCEDEREEAARIASDIRGHLESGGRPADVAVFYRINALTRSLEDELRRQRVPYKIVRGVEFYNRKEIKDVLAYLRVVVNPADEQGLLRAINTPARGIGKTTVEGLKERAAQAGTTLYETLRATIGEGSKISRKLGPFATLLEELATLQKFQVAPIVESVLSRSGLERSLEEVHDVDSDPLANVRELVTAARQYDQEYPEGSLGEWLQQISLMSDADAIDEEGGKVLLMTLHTAKGLEFIHVYMIGLEEGLLPHSRALDFAQPDDLEEERRLCFVGMTRAQRRLTLTHAKYRMIRGVTERRLASSFLRELPADEVQREKFEIERDRSRAHLGRNNWDDESQEQFEYYPGRRVQHEEYGEGEVVRVEPRGKAMYIRVYFPQVGERAFALDHVLLNILD